MSDAREPRIDALRERLCEPELREAREVLARGGPAALVTHARAALALIESERASIQQTASDVATLGERSARVCDAHERRAEVSLALARAACTPEIASTIDVAVLADLARSPGRWSRRSEALAVMAEAARGSIDAAARALVAQTGHDLFDRSEHHWVQAAALSALASAEVDEAHRAARDRLAHPGDGDDLLVRARIVRMVPSLRRQGWWDLLEIAWRDSSDLVRLTAARAERNVEQLIRVAREDPSHKVRALALIALARRSPRRAAAALCGALADDAHGFVVRTAAEELVALARSRKLDAGPEPFEALRHAAHRIDIGPDARTTCVEMLAELDVLVSPVPRAVYDALRPIVEATPVGGATRVTSAALARIAEEPVAQVLAVLARDDFAIGADRRPDGLSVYRGETRAFAPWRALHELLHPSPSKRQAFVHTWGRKPRGLLRAPPGGMAEITATRVPGERVFVERAGGWGRHLPLVDDLLSTGLVRARDVRLCTPFGLVTIAPPPSFSGRLRAWIKLTLSYGRFVEMRRRALESDEPAIQRGYVESIARDTGIRISLTPFAHGSGYARRELPAPAELGGAMSLVLASDPLGALRDQWHDLAAYALAPGGNRLPHLAAYSIAMLGAMLVRSVSIRRSIERDRRAIPLVIGGWGTRGKSGTERLKAALLQGFGHEVLVKTTGCEAMFIHAVPGVPAREIFVYRPYDKATVWEQRDLLRLARRMGARVFLWECMALQPDLVNLLQHQWMRDDLSTITNAYPDHEDVQGPAGVDVAATIGEFVPTNGKLFTAEEQMLPLLRERARERGTTLRVTTARDAELVADDLLARFPYQEHPKNVALVASLARALGISETMAIAEMADHVVPDLGVLKTYPALPWRGRTVSFANGMSANERTGANANWKRAGFAAHDPDIDPNRWIVTVVNNRADRVARSHVFARFLVEDIGARVHVLVGTNVGGLLGFVRDALGEHLEAISPTVRLAGSVEERKQTARARIERAFAKLKVPRRDAESVVAECAAYGWVPPELETIRVLLAPAAAGESLEQAKRAAARGLADWGDEERKGFLAESIARRRAVSAVLALVDALDAEPRALEASFRATYRALFEASLVPVHDAATTGDALIDLAARRVPPGAHAAIMGVQNIKGTGLDFVYRWVSAEAVCKELARLRSASRAARADALSALLVHDDYGLLDATHALAEATRAREEDPCRAELPYDPVIAKLRATVDRRHERMTRETGATVADRLRAFAGETLDFLDSVHRRVLAARVMRELVAGRVSHAAAAVRMRDIVARTKGAWMKRHIQQ